MPDEQVNKLMINVSRKNYPKICGLLFPAYECGELLYTPDKIRISIALVINILLIIFFYSPVLFVSLYYTLSNTYVFFRKYQVVNKARLTRRMNTAYITFMISILFRIVNVIINYLLTNEIPRIFWH